MLQDGLDHLFERKRRIDQGIGQHDKGFIDRQLPTTLFECARAPYDPDVITTGRWKSTGICPFAFMLLTIGVPADKSTGNLVPQGTRTPRRKNADGGIGEFPIGNPVLNRMSEAAIA